MSNGTQRILFPCTGHSVESDRLDLDTQLLAYFRHIKGEYDFRIQIDPMPTPRPRATIMRRKGTGQQFVNVYNPAEYTKYKQNIAILLKDARLGLKSGTYSRLFVTIHLPYNKTEPKKNLIDGAPHRKKPDWDNYIKGFQDALEDAGIILNDGAISDGAVRKRYTTQPQGFISFNLQ